MSLNISDGALKFVSRWRLRWSRGIQWTTVPMTFFSVISMSIIWTPILNQYGIPLWLFIIVTSIGFFGATIFVGYIDDTRNLWKMETDHFNKAVNPYDEPLRKMFVQTETLTNDMEEMKEKIQSINKRVHARDNDWR